MILQSKSKFFCILFVVGFFLIGLSGAVSADQSQKVDKYLSMLESGSMKTRTDAAKLISRSGLKDPVLFDAVEKRLLKGYTRNQGDHRHMDEMAWYCKALASSGNLSYEDTLRKVAQTTTNQNLKRHSSNSLAQIGVVAKRKQIMKEAAFKGNDLTSKESEVIAMLNSDDPVMMRNAAKMTYRHRFSGDAVYDVINEKLLSLSSQSAGNRDLTDSLSWMCKALGASGMVKYRETLTKVIETSSNPKLEKYARQSLNML
jgi:hypothetical protein